MSTSDKELLVKLAHAAWDYIKDSDFDSDGMGECIHCGTPIQETDSEDDPGFGICQNPKCEHATLRNLLRTYFQRHPPMNGQRQPWMQIAGDQTGIVKKPKPKTDDDFLAKYNLVKNTFTKEDRILDGCMFETFGDELERVKQELKAHPKRVWTIVEAEGKWYITPGFHYVNRIGYLITDRDCESESEEYKYG